MELNKNKSGIIFINLSNTKLNKWEQKTKKILGIPILNNYKYLGIIINKQLTPKL